MRVIPAGHLIPEADAPIGELDPPVLQRLPPGVSYCERDAEVIRIQEINEACERMLESDAKYRFVIDVASLKG